MNRVVARGEGRRWLALHAERARRRLLEQEGVAAVEFALVLPLMVVMYLGMTEVSFMVNTNRKLDLASRTLADLTGRQSTMGSTGLLNIMNAAEAVMTPFKTTGITITVTSVKVKPIKNANGEITGATGAVTWSCQRASATTLTAGSLKAGDPVTVPAGFESASSFIRTTLTLPYAPVLGSEVLRWTTGQSSATLERTNPAWPVRDVSEVTWSGSSASSCS